MSPFPSDRGRRDRAREILDGLLPDVRARLTGRTRAARGRSRRGATRAAPPRHHRAARAAVRRRARRRCRRAHLVDLVVDAAVQRPDPLRLLDRRREIDPGWFQRSRMVGYVCYADRFAGTLDGVRQHLDYLGELGVTYLHVMPLLAAARGPQRRRLRGRRLSQRRPAAGHDGRPRGTCRRPARSAACRCASTWCSTTPPPSTRGRRRPCAVTPPTAGSTASSPTGRCRTASRRRCPRSSPTRRRAASPTSRGSAGCGRRSRAFSGTSTGRTPTSSPRCSTRCSSSPTAASTCCASTRRRSCGSARAPTARTSPRCTCSCRRCGRW